MHIPSFPVNDCGIAWVVEHSGSRIPTLVDALPLDTNIVNVHNLSSADVLIVWHEPSNNLISIPLILRQIDNEFAPTGRAEKLAPVFVRITTHTVAALLVDEDLTATLRLTSIDSDGFLTHSIKILPYPMNSAADVRIAAVGVEAVAISVDDREYTVNFD
jgi:hypothetical protein